MSRAPRNLRLLALLLGCTLVVSSCGSDDDDSADDTTTSTTAASDEVTTSSIAATSRDATTTTSAVDDSAQDPPDAGSEDEGLGDPLVFVATLSGDTEVPGPGDVGAGGRVEIESDVAGKLCFDMVATGLDAAVTGSHIHEGPADASGDVVIDIGPPTSTDGDTDSWSDVCVAVADDVIERLNADPSGFYANIHTETYGAGAIRGQLEQATIFDLMLP